LVLSFHVTQSLFSRSIILSRYYWYHFLLKLICLLIYTEPSLPILVSKPKWRAKTPSHWVKHSDDKDNHDYTFVFKDQIGQSLRKPKDLIPPLIPSNLWRFSAETDSAELERIIRFDKNTPDILKRRITEFVKEFWDVFYEDGVKSPIISYELVIDTGDHQPIAVKKPHYGLHEIPITSLFNHQLLL
jgi:hypothetical protein